MAVKKKTAETVKFLTIKVVLNDAPLPIWRRIIVRGDMPLNFLHSVLQVVMGWSESHLYMFENGDVRYGDIDSDESLEGMLDDRTHSVEDVLKEEGAELTYRYDFGDDWVHTLFLEEIVEMAAEGEAEEYSWASCTHGKRACPPEDVGGVIGYANFLDAYEDEEHDEHEEMVEWNSGFDPHSFDIRIANYRLLDLQTNTLMMAQVMSQMAESVETV
jgi:hypothetical protein